MQAFWKFMQGENKPDSRPMVAQVDESDEGSFKEDGGESDADAVEEAKRREIEEDGDGTGEEYEDAEEEGEDEEEEDEGDAGELHLLVKRNSHFTPRTEDELESIILNSLDGVYDDAVATLYKMGYPVEKAKRVLKDYGKCSGDKDVLSNIICNASEYLNVDDDAEVDEGVVSVENREEGGEADSKFHASLGELKRDGLEQMVMKMQEVKPHLGRGDALWELLLAELDITKALEQDGPRTPPPKIAEISGRMRSPISEARSFPSGSTTTAQTAAVPKAAEAKGSVIVGQTHGHLAAQPTAGQSPPPPSSSVPSFDAPPPTPSSSEPPALTSRSNSGHAPGNQGVPSIVSQSSQGKGKSSGKGKQPVTYSPATTAGAGAVVPSNLVPGVHHHPHTDAQHQQVAHRASHTAKHRFHQTHKDSSRVLSSSKTKVVVRSEAPLGGPSGANITGRIDSAAGKTMGVPGGLGAPLSGGTNKDGSVARPPHPAASASAAPTSVVALPANPSASVPSPQPAVQSTAAAALPGTAAANKDAGGCGPSPEGLQVALTGEAMCHLAGGDMAGEVLMHPELTGREYVDMASCLPPYIQISPSALKKWIKCLEVRVGQLRGGVAGVPSDHAGSGRTGELPECRGPAGVSGNALAIPAGVPVISASSDATAGERATGAEGAGPVCPFGGCGQSQVAGTSSMDGKALIGEVEDLLLLVRHHAGKLPSATIEELGTSVDGLMGGSEPWLSALERVLLKDGKGTEHMSRLLQKLKDVLERVSMVEEATLSGSGGALQDEGEDSSRQNAASEAVIPITPIGGKVVTPKASGVGISGRAAGLQDLLVPSPESEYSGRQGTTSVQSDCTPAAPAADMSGRDLSKLLEGIRLFIDADGSSGFVMGSTKERKETGIVRDEAGSARSSTAHVVNSILHKLDLLAESNRELLRHCLTLENGVSAWEGRASYVADLEKRSRELEDELKASKSWTHEKVAQAARRLAKDSHELKTLRAEKEEAGKWKKDLQVLEETTSKKVMDLEGQLRKVGTESGEHQKRFKQLQSELGIAKAEMQAAKLSLAEAQREKDEVVKQLKKLQKKMTTIENQRKKAAEDLTDERRRASQLERDLGQAREQKQQAEVVRRQEEKAREEAVAKYDGEKRAREQAEAAFKRREESLRRKAEIDTGRQREQVQQLERELAQLRLAGEGQLLTTSRWGPQGGAAEPSAFIQALQSSNSRLQRDLAEMQEKLQEATRKDVRRDRECVMCMSEEVCVLFLPCAHEVVCSGCNDRHLKQGMRDCPSCRTIIKQRIRVYGVS